MNRSVDRRAFLSSTPLLALGLALPRSTRGQAQGPRSEPGSRAREEARPPDEVGQSFIIYDDKCSTDPVFWPGGMMPNGSGIAVNLNCRDHPWEGQKCMRISYRLS